MTVNPELGRSLRGLIFALLISVQILPGLAGDPSTSKKGENVQTSRNSGGKEGLNIIFICLGVVAVLGFSVFLFKIWQKKKREEQHARLLRLFEEDDELELELGLRD